jgi:hypothetical protein
VLPCFVLTIEAPEPRPYSMPSPAPAAPTQVILAKKAAKAKGGRAPKATAKQKKKQKLERRLAKRR